MTNHLAIATVTATIQNFLQIAAAQVIAHDIRVTSVSPHAMGTATPETGLNVYLYQIANNSMFSQGGMGGRSRPGEMAKRWRSALDLHYMISFYGNDNTLEPQRLMGATIRALTDQRVLTKEMIVNALTDEKMSFLDGSNLLDQIEEINIMPLDLSLEDLSKVWSVFFQSPYKLSVAYRASVVIIEGDTPSQVALPVRARQFGGVAPFSKGPRIDTVMAQAGKFEPILADSTLLIDGKNLKNQITQVLIDGQEVKPTQITDTQIIVPLSSLSKKDLRAGIHSVQVVHRIPVIIKPPSHQGTSQTPPDRDDTIKSKGIPPIIPAVQSNLAPFTLRPTITKLSVSKCEQDERDRRPDAEVRIHSNLTIGKKQKVVLALNEASIDNPAAYLFEALPRRADAVSVKVPIDGVKPGRYLVRLQVDGAESQLTVDTKPNSKTFNQYIGPKIVIKPPEKVEGAKGSAEQGAGE
ncbi:MAG TPA: DUF4255 domain-containing protein [Cyanobacteria bacterium UBA11149]|nr:DUF4255 domain-containing protein [Cyanobacteria bacterium UBA11367]HBE58451.1 DUF4255 domain-containing protein [Cyanobacteria bacterium UBA11366]HBK65496.1 DUF4255 domain-containing protein [Cyanobacteria bacterium UBA11166]HBR73478.1 DUF4255 domain-containing protein [Cyanobacteria bacterium UBA11159]HBS71811.1 DUF4255 domain-containing protein [Cyanobacteria bacterium UBA11153]HBW90758.1 DUF4255 domain-containing protein [Cyanobacteria bacterium UBA11149]HCA94261.1 DUF4255 domain-conta